MTNLNSETTSKSNGMATDMKSKNAEYRLEKISHEVGTKIGESFRTGREYVRENPAKGVAIAALAGVVAGSLLTMILRRRPGPQG